MHCFRTFVTKWGQASPCTCVTAGDQESAMTLLECCDSPVLKNSGDA